MSLKVEIKLFIVEKKKLKTPKLDQAKMTFLVNYLQ